VSICINPWCPSRNNDDQARHCSACGTSLLVNGRFRLQSAISDLESDRSVDVYEALDVIGSSNVSPNTIRILKVCKSRNETIIKLFVSEAEALQVLDYPSIPTSYYDDYFTVEIEQYQSLQTLRCFALEKIPGQTLDEWLHKHGPVSQLQALEWLEQFAEILDYLHDQKFIHQDINLSNVMVTPEGTIALIDFGLTREMTNTYFAKVAFGGEHPLERGGTFGFTPPEQLIGKPIPQSDFYALGRTFIVLLTGKYFYELEVENGQLQWEKEAPQVDQRLVRLINRLCSHEITDRPKTTMELMSNVGELFLEPSMFGSEDSETQDKTKHRNLTARINNQLKFLGILTFFILTLLGASQLVQRYFALQLFFSATAQANDGQWEEAKRTLERSLNLNPTAVGHEKLGEVCYEMGDIECAMTQFRKAIEMAPASYFPYLRLGKVFEDVADYQNAKNTYLQGAKVTEHPSIKNSLARLFIIRKEYDNAELFLRDAIQSKNATKFFRAGMFKNMAWINFDRGKYNQAVYYASESIKLDNEFIVPYCLKAVAKARLNLNSKSEWESCLTKPTTDSSVFEEVVIWREIYMKNSVVDKKE
jgi:serine/threonine protein kinase